ncbi:MAG: 30S ribosomal protein S18 [Planctomycetota bacterium]|nr:MAG: 30S ribosomal protein S18 [Planctomycetota bacterium]
MSNREDRGGGWKGFTGVRKKSGKKGRGCKSCDFVDYKDVPTLKRFLNAHGKLFSRKRSRTCPKCQRLIKQAVKRARFMGILSYTN